MRERKGSFVSMMKLWSRVCFLVLVISRTSRGQNLTLADDLKGTNSSTDDSYTTEVPSKNNTDAPMLTSPPSQWNTTNVNSTESKGVNREREEDVSNRTEVSPVVPVTASGGVAGATTTPDVTVSTTTGGTLPKPEEAKSSSWGYVILVLIILVIVILCIILYLLRRVSRTYSFDLQRPIPSRSNEPTGTFEPVYLDDLDRPVPKDDIPTDDLSPPPVANGTSLPSEEKGSNGETVAPQDQPDGTGVEPSPVGNGSPTSAEDSADQAPSLLNSTNFFFDDLGHEQQNENNNHPSVCSSDPFVEINLDEPALCDFS